MGFELGPRRGKFIDITDHMRATGETLSPVDEAHLEAFDLVYRSLCASLYNYVPASGHPGGSISSGRFVAALLFETMDYDISNPDREDADLISYAAGHKALGIYALWALRDELARIGGSELLPPDVRLRLRMEDLLGFRRNPAMATPLMRKLDSKPLDGHPTPATPFVPLSTGASGVGVASSLGLAFAARDVFGPNAPKVHIVEGEGGLTPGRAHEALAAAGTASLDNAILHLDWNQASIDSNRVCREGKTPGDYVQWDPTELFMLHDWNVILVPDGKDFRQITAAQTLAKTMESTQPTAIIYRTVKGWRYGIEGRLSHGAGHKLCSDGFIEALRPLLGERVAAVPFCCDRDDLRCQGAAGSEVMEACFWETLGILRKELAAGAPMVAYLAGRLRKAKSRLDGRPRLPRQGVPQLQEAYALAARDGARIPEELQLKPGAKTTLRAELGRVLNHYNKASHGAFLIAAADLLGSTSIDKTAAGFPAGYWNATGNPGSRTLSVGGICEDAMAGIFSGLSAYGHHVGVASSYAAFLAPLGHIASRLHAIGNQARRDRTGQPYRPMILACAHAGLKTGEDGPTHADPQALQLLQENFPAGAMITLTPFDPQEMWPLVSAALARRPAVIAPFVTRPAETVPDRKALGLPPATEARSGVYALRRGKNPRAGSVVLQGSGVGLEFVETVLPKLIADGVDLNVFYVASAELFDALPREEQERIFPEALAQEAMGITGFTLPTLYRWVRSDRGRNLTLHPYRKGRYLGSGVAAHVLAEAGLDGESQLEAIRKYLDAMVHTPLAG